MKFSPRKHILERGYDRRRSRTIELGKSVDQQLQAWREPNRLSLKHLTKPLPDLIADRATVYGIDPYICGVLFRHHKIQQHPARIK
jgi:hypothetical protein